MVEMYSRQIIGNEVNNDAVVVEGVQGFINAEEVEGSNFDSDKVSIIMNFQHTQLPG